MAAEEGLERTRLAEFGGSFDGRINKTKPKKRKEKKNPKEICPLLSQTWMNNS